MKERHLPEPCRSWNDGLLEVLRPLGRALGRQVTVQAHVGSLHVGALAQAGRFQVTARWAAGTLSSSRGCDPRRIHRPVWASHARPGCDLRVDANGRRMVIPHEAAPQSVARCLSEKPEKAIVPGMVKSVLQPEPESAQEAEQKNSD